MVNSSRIPRIFTRKQLPVVIAAGIALNIVLSMTASALKLPLFLDTVGTIAVSVLGGYIPGILVGLATNIVKSIFKPSEIYYAGLNILIAIIARWLGDRGWFKKVGGVIGVILIFTLLGGIVGALIPWFIEGIPFYSEALCETISETAHLSYGVSFYLASIISDLPDKTVSVLLALGIIHLTRHLMKNKKV